MWSLWMLCVLWLLWLLLVCGVHIACVVVNVPARIGAVLMPSLILIPSLVLIPSCILIPSFILVPSVVVVMPVCRHGSGFLENNRISKIKNRNSKISEH